MIARALQRLLVCLATGNATADIQLDRTRIIYPASQREVSITLTNEASTPRVVQAWMDEGDAHLQPEYSDVPFSVVPPMLRIEPGKGQALRITYHPGQGVATGRESVYWLNVLSIPPTGNAEAGNTLRWAFRTRIKLFLRPERLPARTEQPLHWQWRRAGLEAYNPSAYHVTLSQVVLNAHGVDYRSADPPMIAPHSTAAVSLESPVKTPSAKATLRYRVLDDHGVARDYEQAL